MRDFSAEREPTKSGIVELPGNERIYCLDRLPPEVFLKGFLRAFARAVGADEREALALYLVRRGVQEASHPAAAGPFSSTTRSPGGWKLAVLLAALAGLIAVSTLVYHHWTQGRPAETTPPAAATIGVPGGAMMSTPVWKVERPVIGSMR